MSHHSNRTVDERTSSYRRHFGDGRGSLFTYGSPSRGTNRTVTTTRTYRSTGGAVGGGPLGAVGGQESHVSFRTIPVQNYAAASTHDINMMADSLGPEFHGTRVNEKEELQTLNSRFAEYITKVRNLEQANRVLEEQVSQLSSTRHSRLAEEYDEELSRLRREIDSLTNERSNLGLQLENALQDVQKWRNKFEDEAATRKEMEDDLQGMRKDCDDATLVRLDLERRLETLQEEIDFLKRTHQEEVDDLQERIRTTEIKIDAAPGPDLDAMLQDIRKQYEQIAAKNKVDADRWYEERLESLQRQSAKNDEAMKGAKSEVSEYRKTVQTLNLEIDSLRGTNDALQRNIGDLEDRYNRDLTSQQDVINNLQGEMDDLKAQMAQHLRQYQELMDVKMALDVEIATYRRLLEGEEHRVDMLVDARGDYPISDKVQSMRSIPKYSASTSYSVPSYSRNVQQQETADTRSGEDVETITTKKVVVKTIETKDGKVVSQSEDVRESSGKNDEVDL